MMIFLKSLKILCTTYIKFNMEYSLYAIFLLKAHRNNDISMEDFLFLKNGKQELMKGISKCQKNGKLSEEYDVEFIFYCISQMLLGMGMYVKKNVE